MSPAGRIECRFQAWLFSNCIQRLPSRNSQADDNPGTQQPRVVPILDHEHRRPWQLICRRLRHCGAARNIQGKPQHPPDLLTASQQDAVSATRLENFRRLEKFHRQHRLLYAPRLARRPSFSPSQTCCSPANHGLGEQWLARRRHHPTTIFWDGQAAGCGKDAEIRRCFSRTPLGGLRRGFLRVQTGCAPRMRGRCRCSGCAWEWAVCSSWGSGGHMDG